jgi:hypothetical protein
VEEERRDEMDRVVERSEELKDRARQVQDRAARAQDRAELAEDEAAPPRNPRRPGTPQRRLTSVSRVSDWVTGGPSWSRSCQVPTTVPWPQST